MITVKNLYKSYHHPIGRINILNNVNLDINEGGSTAVIGESGRGKTTLLYLLAGLDRADSGSIKINEKYIESLDEEEMSAFRAKNIGFVFQHHFLLGDLDALDNALLPLRVTNNLTRENIDWVIYLFDLLGIMDRTKHQPEELSGGEKQRVAVIRALANRPLVLFADEPTGSLDKENAELLEELLFSTIEKYGTTLLLSTHSSRLASSCKQILTIDEIQK